MHRRLITIALCLLLLPTLAHAAIQNVHGCASNTGFPTFKLSAGKFRVFTDCANTQVRGRSYNLGVLKETLFKNTRADCIADFSFDTDPVDEYVFDLMPNCTGAFGTVTITYNDMDVSNALVGCALATAPCISPIGSSRECNPKFGGCAPVPTLPEWGLIALAALLLTVGFLRI